jgi:hypothetical protein
MWLPPAMIASSGPIPFLQANLDYVFDQASVSSALFGASDRRWVTRFWRLLVWVYCGVLAWGMAAALAFRRKDGFAVARNQVAFLALWLLPWLAFSLTVHVEDPGQTLAMVPVVCLIGGSWWSGPFRRRWPASRGCWFRSRLPRLLCATGSARRTKAYTRCSGCRSLVGLGVDLALRTLPVPARSSLPRAAAIAVVLAPVMVLNYTFYYNGGWYYKGAAVSGIEAVAERAWADINAGFALTSVQQIESTLGVDDHTLREARRLIAERRGRAVILWEEGPTSWRKAAYDVPDTRIAVLEHQKMRSRPRVVAWWRGPKLEQRLQGGAPLRLTVPAGVRLVWLLNTNSAFYQEAQRSFPLSSAGPMWFTDLPSESGARVLGEYEVSW